MTVLRILNLIAWSAVLAYMLPTLISLARGKPRAGDPARLVPALFAIVVIGFDLRHLAMPESEAMRIGMILFGTGVALFTIKVARSYGRGDHVG